MLMLTLLNSWFQRRSQRKRVRSAWEKAVRRNALPRLEDLEKRLVPTLHVGSLASSSILAELASISTQPLISPTSTHTNDSTIPPTTQSNSAPQPTHFTSPPKAASGNPPVSGPGTGTGGTGTGTGGGTGTGNPGNSAASMVLTSLTNASGTVISVKTPTNSRTPTLIGTGTPNLAFSAKVDGKSIGSSTVNASGTGQFQTLFRCPMANIL